MHYGSVDVCGPVWYYACERMGMSGGMSIARWDLCLALCFCERLIFYALWCTSGGVDRSLRPLFSAILTTVLASAHHIMAGNIEPSLGHLLRVIFSRASYLLRTHIKLILGSFSCLALDYVIVQYRNCHHPPQHAHKQAHRSEYTQPQE